MSLVNELLKGLLPEEKKQQTTAVYAGGFKPPTSGHFEVVQQALKENPEIDEFIIFIGAKERDGISQDESLLIWEIYNNYLPFKVKIEPTSIPPIKAVYDFAKNHPTREVLWVIGAREGNEEDFKDITSRTTSISKYPNLELRTIVTAGGVSGTAARNAAKVSFKKFEKFVPDILSPEEKQEVYNIISDKIEEKKQNLNESLDPKEFNFGPYIKSLTTYMEDNGLNLQPSPEVEFVHDEVENGMKLFGNTAYYTPDNNKIVLFTYGRHPKDILRSYAHELVHVHQNMEDRLEDYGTTNVNQDDRLENIEREAYETGNILFRSWTNSVIEEGKKGDKLGIKAFSQELARLREEEGKYKIYLDMDGVVADFDQRFRSLSGMEPSEFENKFGKNEFWDFIDKKHKISFWVGIPVMDGAKELVDFVSKHDYVMLTAPSARKESRLGKLLWVRNHVGDVFSSKPQVIFKKAKEKHEVKPELTNFDILIDDRQSTIDNWNNAGGTGILYQSASQVISDLQKLGL